MNILAISGSARQASTNTALLQAMKDLAPRGVDITVFHELHALPVFSPDLEGDRTPDAVRDFADAVAAHDAIIISSPEYVHAIPGGLKNAIDWLVSRFEVVGKPIALVHASHRGDDMLASLRLVLSTVSDQFANDLFLRVPLVGMSPDEVAGCAKRPEQVAQVRSFLLELQARCGSGNMR